MSNADYHDSPMLCIICMQMKPRRTSGGEHIIPYALGGSFTINRVCEDCDSRLGHDVDADLIAHYKVEQTRADLELRGQSGSIPDPQARALDRPFTGTENPNFRVRFERGASGELEPKILSRVQFKLTKATKPDGTPGMLIEPVNVFIDPADAHLAEDLAKEALRRAGLTDEEQVSINARHFAENLETVFSPQVVTRQIAIRSGGHQQGLLKIAYEFAWYWLGDAWLRDPIAIAMRKSLNGGETSGIHGKVYDDPDVAVIAREGDQRVVHVVYLYEWDGKLLLFVRLFDLFAAGFEIAGNASEYTVPKLNAIVMQVEQRRYEETTFGPMEPGSVVWKHDPTNSPIK